MISAAGDLLSPLLAALQALKKGAAAPFRPQPEITGFQ